MSLINNLISYWPMDEVSGDRADKHGSNTLTDNNTVGSAAGIISNGADFERSNSEVFSAADSVSLSFTGDWSFNFWIKLEQTPSGAGAAFVFLEKASSYGALAFNTNAFRVQFQNGANISNKDYSGFFVAGDVGNWRMVTMTCDVSAGANGISLYKNGVVKTGSVATNNATSVGDTANTFYMGASNLSVNFTDGVMDEVGLWGRVLTSSEVTELYNGGAGLAYPFSGGAIQNSNFLALL